VSHRDVEAISVVRLLGVSCAPRAGWSITRRSGLGPECRSRNRACHWSHHTQPVSSFMCIWVSRWHALVQITAPGEPFSGGYSSPQNGRAISELALWAGAPELPASAPFVMSASLVRPAPTCPPHSLAQPVQRGRLTGTSVPTSPCLNPVGRLVLQERGFFYLAVTCRLHIRDQRAALDTWRGRFGGPFPTRAPIRLVAQGSSLLLADELTRGQTGRPADLGRST
jgi:hypothetical protein